MKNILVTIDFDNIEDLLIEKACELAKPFDSKLWLVHIAGPEPAFVGYKLRPQYIRDNRAKELRKEHRLIREYTNKLKEKCFHAEGLLIQGATVEMIMYEAEKLNIDLIIADHHDHGFLYKALIGSISSEIIKKTKTPVLIVPVK